MKRRDAGGAVARNAGFLNNKQKPSALCSSSWNTLAAPMAAGHGKGKQISRRGGRVLAPEQGADLARQQMRAGHTQGMQQARNEQKPTWGPQPHMRRTWGERGC